jgi:RES domain-containing protein
MIHDVTLLDKLASFEVAPFAGDVYRASRKSLDPLAASTSGGRWMPKGEASVLYTSLAREGALAELVFHWSMLNPLPSKPAVISQLHVSLDAALRILRVNLLSLGVDEALFQSRDYKSMQKIGAAVAFLGCHGLIVPSARWSTENLIVFTDNLDSLDVMAVTETNEVDLLQWGREHDFLDD